VLAVDDDIAVDMTEVIAVQVSSKSLTTYETRELEAAMPSRLSLKLNAKTKKK
jgi:hypothetical protein